MKKSMVKPSRVSYEGFLLVPWLLRSNSLTFELFKKIAAT